MNEEEKKAVNELKEEINKPVEVQGDKFNTFILYNIESAKTVLNLIEKLQKEKEELEEINNELEAEKNEAIRRYNFETITIQKVKDKIEKLNKKEKEELKGMKGQDRYFVKQTYQNKRMILQELIKESEE